ncbi:MAG: DeoR/GlpR transcriptional regulator [Devosia sp.]|uniref:DeoR/GlpR family DNA-binding transcription regulator n=1 Tax=Devosia sp. TaxID=1871048 RepID=UPI001A472838|nr:DeoR/GlpR family DNA-binding transcription regulator [Devosia sp.]MBL8597806.1 DeoR/GlpR transcriptional regulator [Devosia sp.]
MKTDRLSLIRQHLYSHGPASVQQLADATGASLATLRRDLAALEAEGVIDRSHGGARLAQGSSVEVSFDMRETEHIANKRMIADAAYRLIKPHSTIFLDSGTTILQLARRLRLDPMPIVVFTNGLAVAQELLTAPRIRVMLLGGQLRPDNASIVGPQAEAMLERLHFDQLFMGASAIADDGMICSVDVSEASLNGKMLARSRQKVLMADSSKFGAVATYAVAPIGTASVVICDAGLDPRWQQTLAQSGVDLLLATPSTEPDAGLRDESELA